MKAIFAFALSAILDVTQASGMKPGPCPSFTSQMPSDRLNHTKLGGLWYEFAYTADFTEELPYDCASWNMLMHSRNSTDQPSNFEVLHHSMNKTTGKTDFQKHSMTCPTEFSAASQSCLLKTKDAPTVLHEYTFDKPRKFQVVNTDMFSHMEAAVCTEYGLFHYIDYVVLTREKQPSLYTRKQVLNTLTGALGMSDSDVQGLVKGKAFDCWGEDKYL